MASSDRPGLRKIGFLKKLKTMKKKLFVLYQDDGNRAARLEYYDSEKKYKNAAPAKRTIILKDCLSINPKSDAKHKHAIALYTKDDCFGIACESENEQREWLGALEELQQQIHEPANDGESPRPNFEHIWPVQVKNRGLGCSSLTPGQYRLCLTNRSLSFIKINNTEPDIGFQLASIRRCGHTDAFFYMELGRSSCTGAGELWMQVEDTVIAQNMHEAILSSMKTMNTAAEQPNYRPRSRSTADKSIKPSSSSSSSTSAASRHSTVDTTSISSSTLPLRSHTMSASQWEHPKSPLRRHQSSSKPSSSSSLHRSATMSYRDSSASTVAGSPLSALTFGSSSEGMYRQRTDSMGSSSHRTDSSLSDDVDATANSNAHSSTYGSDHFALDRDMGGYLDMQPQCKDLDATPGYLNMTPAVSGGRRQMSVADDLPAPEGYMNMSPAATDHSGGESPAVSMTSCHDDDYSSMVSRSLSTVQEKATDPSYMEMSGGGGKHSHAMSLHLEKVPSFLSDELPGLDFPMRANSCGSRQDAVQKAQSYAYLDMSGSFGSKKGGSGSKSSSKSISAPHLPPGIGPKQGLPKPRTDSGSSSTADVNESILMALDFTPKDGGGIRPRTASGGSHRDMGIRPRTSSCGQQDAGFRTRTSSFGSIAKTLLGRHNKELDRGSTSNGDGTSTSSSSSPHRPRTATICQDAFRARAGSFGPADAMRPRSASHGHARYRELRRTHTTAGSLPASSSSGVSGSSPSSSSVVGGARFGPTGSVGTMNSRHSSQESLKGKAAAVVGRMSSRESVSSSTSEYLDMNPGRNSPSMSSLQRQKDRRLPADEYMQMSPQNMDEYVPMDPPKKPDRSSGAYPKSSLSSKLRSSGSNSSIHGKHNSSSESLSSGSEGRGRTRVMLNTSTDMQDHNEYMDFDFQSRSSPSSSSKHPSFASSPSGSRSPKSKSRDADDSSYVSYSPGGSSSREHSPNLVRSGPFMDKVISPIRESGTSGSSLVPPFNPSPMTMYHGFKGKGATTSQAGKHEYVNVQYKQTETVYEQMEYQAQETPPPEEEPTPKVSEPQGGLLSSSKPALPESRPKSVVVSPENEYMGFDFGPKKTEAKSEGIGVPRDVTFNPKVMSLNPSKSVDEDEDSYMLCNPATNRSGLIQPVPPLPPPQQKPQQIDRDHGVAKITVSALQQQPHHQQQHHHHHHHLMSRYSPPPSSSLPSSSLPSTASKPTSTVSLKSALLASKPSTATTTTATAITNVSAPPSVVATSSSSATESPYMDFNPTASKTTKTAPTTNAADTSDYMEFNAADKISKTTKSDLPKNANLNENSNSTSDTKDRSEELVLNYATLDLGDATDDSAKSTSCGGGKKSDDGVAIAKGGPSYTEIDFQRSQELLQMQEQEAKKETKAPFDCL